MAFFLVSIGVPELENMRRLHKTRRRDAIASMNEGTLRGPSKQPLLSPEFQSLLWVHYFLETEMKRELLLAHGNGIYLFHLS